MGEAEESLGKITVMPSKGADFKKGELKMVRATQCCLYDLQVHKRLTREKDPLLQHVSPTQIVLSQYGLVAASKWGFGSILSMPKEVSYGM